MERLDPHATSLFLASCRLVAVLLFQRALFLQHLLQPFGESSGVQFVSPLTILQKKTTNDGKDASALRLVRCKPTEIVVLDPCRNRRRDLRGNGIVDTGSGASCSGAFQPRAPLLTEINRNKLHRFARNELPSETNNFHPESIHVRIVSEHFVNDRSVR